MMTIFAPVSSCSALIVSPPLPMILTARCQGCALRMRSASPGHQVAWYHHLEAGPAAAEVASHTAAAATAWPSAATAAATCSLVGDDVVDEVASNADGLGRPCEGAQTVWHPLQILVVNNGNPIFK
jgi:hypothetical protein